MRALTKAEGSLKWWFLACLLALALGIGFMGFNQWSATQDKYVAQSNAETLAKDISTICTTEGKFVINNRDLCDKGADVLENPTSLIAGPKGDPGTPGENGRNGADSTVPGPPGPNGSNGANGVNGTDSKVPGPPGQDGADGSNGTNGADSTVPGPQGATGKQGAKGETGPSPSSFKWTDSKTGTKYTCVPDPVGSTTYTCTEEQTTPTPTK